jgi:hypothetical protein
MFDFALEPGHGATKNLKIIGSKKRGFLPQLIKLLGMCIPPTRNFFATEMDGYWSWREHTTVYTPYKYGSGQP